MSFKILKSIIALIVVLVSLKPAFAEIYSPFDQAFTVKTTIPMVKPGYLEYRIDPVFNTYIQRISDSATFYPGQSTQGKVIAHQYSKRQAWNSDGSRLFLGAKYPGWLLNGNNFNYAKIRPIEQLSDAVWANTKNNIMYGFLGKQSIPGGPYDIYNDFYMKTVNLTGTIDTDTLIATFLDFKKMDIGGSEGEVDNNDNYVVLTGEKNDGSKELILYSIVNKQIIARLGLRAANFNNAQISQSGRYIVTYHDKDTTLAANSPFSGINVYSRLYE